MSTRKRKIPPIESIVFDFDGVLTDNRVYVDTQGNETVACNRSDGLGFDVLRRTPVRAFILSTERNDVVLRRAEKVRVPCVHGVRNKRIGLQELAAAHKLDLARTLYVGNDVNDYEAMKLCGFSACPSDSHPRIRKLARFKLRRAGGAGIVMEIVEELLGLDSVALLAPGLD